MSKIDNVRRIVVEDYEEEFRPLIEKLSFILNRFMDQTVLQINGNIDVDNLKVDRLTFKTKLTGGSPDTDLQVKTKIKKPAGTWVIRALNKTTGTNYPTTAPFISYEHNSSTGIMTIKDITGLQDSDEWELTIVVF